MKKSNINKLGLNKLWEVLLAIGLITFSYTFILYLFDRFTILTHEYTFIRFVLIAAFSIIFYPPFYSNKVRVRFKYFASICLIYLSTVLTTTLILIYVDKPLKSEYVEIEIQKNIERDQQYLASKNRKLDVENSYAVVVESVNDTVSFRSMMVNYITLLIISLLLSYLMAYFFTYKSFSQFNSSNIY